MTCLVRREEGETAGDAPSAARGGEQNRARDETSSGGTVGGMQSEAVEQGAARGRAGH